MAEVILVAETTTEDETVSEVEASMEAVVVAEAVLVMVAREMKRTMVTTQAWLVIEFAEIGGVYSG